MTRPFAWIARALLSHYWRHPWQALFLATGLVAGTGLWAAVQLINQHAEASYADAQNLLGVQAQYWIESRRDEGIEQSRYIALRRAGFRQVFPVIEIGEATPDGVTLSLIATDLMALPGESIDDGDDDFGGDWLDFIQPPYRAWVPASLAAELGLADGERLLLRDGRRLPPALIQAREQQGRRILLDIGAAQALAGDDRLTYLAVGRIEPEEAERLRAALPAQLALVENQQHLDLRQLTASLHTHLTAMSLLSFAVGLFIVFNAVRFSLWQRRATLLDLRLMGCSMPALIAAIAFETLLWSLFGALAGTLLGVVLAQALLPGLGASLQGLYGAAIGNELLLAPATWLKAWGIALGGLALALGWPLARQLRHSILGAADSGNRLADDALARRRLALAALVVGAAAALALPRVDTVVGGFAVLGGVLFAAAWLLPALLAGGLRAVGALLPRRHLLARWLVSDGWAQLPALRSATMALLLALTANLGVGTLVDSFRSAFVGWLEVRQSADLYLRSRRPDYPALVAAGREEGWLAGSHYRIGVDTRWRGRPALVRGVDTGAPDSLELPLARWSGDSAEAARRAWRERPGTVLVNEQAYFLGGARLGETVTLDSDDGPLELTVVGVFYDYGNPYYQFFLPRATLAEHWRYPYGRGIALWLSGDDPAALGAAEAALTRMGVLPGDWIRQDEIRRLSIGIFDRTFAITAAMNTLTLLVAAIALAASLLAILQERLPEFAQWRALGLRGREQLWLMTVPLALFCALAWLLAIPLGALLSWILIDRINIISFGWSMPLDWSLLPALELGAMVALICLLTVLLATWRARRRLPRALASLGEVL